MVAGPEGLVLLRLSRLDALEHVERPDLAGGADWSVGPVLRVPGGEVRTSDPRAEGLLRTPARHHQAQLALVVRTQQLEALEPVRRLDSPGARREPSLELVEALARNRDRVDLDDAHRARTITRPSAPVASRPHPLRLGLPQLDPADLPRQRLRQLVHELHQPRIRIRRE